MTTHAVFHVHTLAPLSLGCGTSEKESSLRSQYRNNGIAALRKNAVMGAAVRSANFRSVKLSGESLQLADDLRLLLAPVRTSRDGYFWVTTKSLLREYLTAFAGDSTSDTLALVDSIADPDEGTATVPDTIKGQLGESVFFEELQLHLLPAPECSRVADFLTGRSFVIDRHGEEKLRSGLAIVSDSTFLALAQSLLSLHERAETTQQRGDITPSLVEFLPSECVFFTTVAVSSAEMLSDLIESRACTVLQLGRDENTGAGFCRGSFDSHALVPAPQPPAEEAPSESNDDSTTETTH